MCSVDIYIYIYIYIFSVADVCPDSSEAMAGESEEVIDARKTKMVPAKKSAPGSRREESTEFTGILPRFRQEFLSLKG